MVHDWTTVAGSRVSSSWLYFIVLWIQLHNFRPLTGWFAYGATIFDLIRAQKIMEGKFAAHVIHIMLGL